MLWDDGQDTDLLAYFQHLISMRRQHPALTYGEILSHKLDDDQGVWIAQRWWGSDNMVVAVNAGEELVTVRLPQGKWQRATGEVAGAKIDLAPLSVSFYSARRD